MLNHKETARIPLSKLKNIEQHQVSADLHINLLSWATSCLSTAMPLPFLLLISLKYDTLPSYGGQKAEMIWASGCQDVKPVPRGQMFLSQTHKCPH